MDPPRGRHAGVQAGHRVAHDLGQRDADRDAGAEAGAEVRPIDRSVQGLELGELEVYGVSHGSSPK